MPSRPGQIATDTAHTPTPRRGMRGRWRAEPNREEREYGEDYSRLPERPCKNLEWRCFQILQQWRTRRIGLLGRNIGWRGNQFSHAVGVTAAGIIALSHADLAEPV